jgi:acyl-CoA synthetase (AMP-forming)/AMP-acid ligase II
MFASPAFLHRVGRYAEERGITLPSLKRVVSGGAPVTPSILECFRNVLSPEARLSTTYGATEALPIASIDAHDVLEVTQHLTRNGKGTCVGKPVGLEVRVIRISDDPIARWSDDLLVRPGEVGEIVIAGRTVSPRYHGSDAWNTRHKIGNWHRTGDLGWIDPSGRLWFCGRKSQRVETKRGLAFTVQWEGIFNAHPDVYRTALVPFAGEPVICVELRHATDRARVESELREMARERSLEVKAFLFKDDFPVDIRHNAKIGREELARWAARQLTPRKPWLYAVPVAGWIFILLGLLLRFEHPVLRALWLIDVILSVGVHGLQLFVALPRGRRAGYSTAKTVFYTFLFGATWWKFLRAGGPT